MYRFKDREIMDMYNMKIVAETIGLHPDTLRRIAKGEQLCSKVTAYCLTKFLNCNSEILDYFDYEEKGE